MKAVVYSYLLFLLANVLDILSSYGQPEGNPLMQNVAGDFDLYHSVVVKLCVSSVLIATSWIVCKIGSGLDKSIGYVAAASVPVYYTFNLLHVFYSNIFTRLGWY